MCGEKATAADHIINLASGGTFDGPLQSLYAEHHRQTQAEIEAGQQAAGSQEEEGTMNLIGYHIVQQETAEEAKRIRKELESFKLRGGEVRMGSVRPVGQAANLRATPKPQIDRPLPKTIPVPQPPYTPTPPPTKE